MGISVVVCTYNGRERLAPTLNAILGQTFDKNKFELIVVDNASSDDTNQFCNQLLSQSSFGSWKVITESQPGLNFARLRGVREASFDFVLFCDDDNILQSDYLEVAHLILYSNSNIGVLGGFGVPAFEEEKPEWFDQHSHSFAVGPQARQNGHIKQRPASVYGAASFFRKEPLVRIFANGHTSIMSDRKEKSLASGGDLELCFLIQLAGYEVWYDNRLIFQHMMPKARMQWGYYLKLKTGIASGSGRLLGHRWLIEEPNFTSFQFLLRILIQSGRLILSYSKYLLSSLLHKAPTYSPEEIDNVVLKTKIRVWWRNAFDAYSHFEKLRRIRLIRKD